MPQASADLRRKWGDEGGAGDGKAIAFLEQHGWRQEGTGMWRAPSDRQPTDAEYEALTFLCDEWDHDFHPL